VTSVCVPSATLLQEDVAPLNALTPTPFVHQEALLLDPILHEALCRVTSIDTINVDALVSLPDESATDSNLLALETIPQNQKSNRLRVVDVQFEVIRNARSIHNARLHAMGLHTKIT